VRVFVLQQDKSVNKWIVPYFRFVTHC